MCRALRAAHLRLIMLLVRERHRTDLQLETMHLRLAALRGKRPKRLPKVPPDEAIERMIASVRKRPCGTSIHEQRIRLRNIAMLETLKGSGVRVSELVSLRSARCSSGCTC